MLKEHVKYVQVINNYIMVDVYRHVNICMGNIEMPKESVIIAHGAKNLSIMSVFLSAIMKLDNSEMLKEIV